MKIIFDLPEWDNKRVHDLFSGGPARWCYVCRTAAEGPMVRFDGSWWHVGCLEETFAADAVKNKLLSAWLTVALDVSRYPSKHSASVIRAVIRNLIAGPMMNALWRAGKEEGERGKSETVESPRQRGGDEADAGLGEGADGLGMEPG